MNSSSTSCDQPTMKIISGSTARSAAIVSGELTSAVSIRRAPSSAAISSNEH